MKYFGIDSRILFPVDFSFFKIGKKINKQILSLPFSRDFRTKDEIPDFLPLVHTKFFDRFSTGDRFPSISFRVQISTEPRNDAGIKIEIKISIQSTKDSVYYYSILDFHPTPFSKLVAFFVTIAWFSWLKTVFVYERKDLNIVHRFNFFNLISSALIFCFVLQVNIFIFVHNFFFFRIYLSTPLAFLNVISQCQFWYLFFFFVHLFYIHPLNGRKDKLSS